MPSADSPSPILIINADDFGRSHDINLAVIRAHREGVLTSASLMVAGEAVDEAVELARQNPKLAVGLHVVAVDGPAVLPHQVLSRITGESGQFPNAPVRLGLRYAFSRAARQQLDQELVAQFERFAATGLPLSHVDGHQHMHMHPAVFGRVVKLARKFGAVGIRIVRDDPSLAIRQEPAGAVGKWIEAAIFRLLALNCRGHALPAPWRTYGFHLTGRMTEAYVLSVVRQVRESAEIYFHPTQGPRLDRLGPNPEELAVLLSQDFRREIGVRQLRLGCYKDVADSSVGERKDFEGVGTT